MYDFEDFYSKFRIILRISVVNSVCVCCEEMTCLKLHVHDVQRWRAPDDPHLIWGLGFRYEGVGLRVQGVGFGVGT